VTKFTTVIFLKRTRVSWNYIINSIRSFTLIGIEEIVADNFLTLGSVSKKSESISFRF